MCPFLLAERADLMERSQVDRAPVVLTTTPLAASATAYYPSKNGESRTGSTFLVAYVRAVAWSDQAGSLILEESDDDAVTWAQTGSTVTVSASTIATFAQTALTKKSWRWKYINGSTIQTKFNLLEDREPASANVKVTDALPAGTANIGDVDVLSIAAGDNNIGNVDLASAIPAGTNNIGDVDVASIATGANIIGKVGIDQTTPGTTNGVQVNAALPAGTNNIGDVDIASAIPAGSAIIGQVGIDQTTPGTTNGVQVNAALPAGDNNIGNVDIASAIPAGANVIGKVSIDQTTPGTTNLVDTELPAAAALADAAANPTTPTVGAALKVWNGTTWDNADGVNTGQLVVTQKNSSGNELDIASTATSNGISSKFAAFVQAVMTSFNGTTWDHWRNNTEGTLLASAATTVTRTSAVQTNYNGEGVNLILDVTANPGGAETLAIRFYDRDGMTGRDSTAKAAFTIPAATNSRFVLQIKPGATTTPQNPTFNNNVAMGIPRSWSADVNPSATGSWTYSLDNTVML